MINSRKLPPLKSLIGFEAVARLQSVRGAAQSLNLTHPAVSHQIKVLEDHLNVQLFKKNGRNIELTEAGEAFQQYVTTALNTLQEGVLALEGVEQKATINLQAYITLSIRWLAVRLSDFRMQYPDIELKLLANNGAWEFDERHADIAVIYKQAPLADHLHWTPLFPSQIYPVCSPKLIGEKALPISVQSLSEYPLLMVSSEKQYWSWQQWFSAVNVEPSSKIKMIEVDTLAVALEMAGAGGGVALVNGPVADYDLGIGKLVRPLHEVVRGSGEWGLVLPHELFKQPHIQAFIVWLKEQAKEISVLENKG